MCTLHVTRQNLYFREQLKIREICENKDPPKNWHYTVDKVMPGSPSLSVKFCFKEGLAVNLFGVNKVFQ